MKTTMKITPEHYAVMRDAIKQVTQDKAQVDAYRAALLKDQRVNDVATRMRWDIMWAAKLGPFLCEHVYTYANDTHIDTALRAIMRELGLDTSSY